MIKKLLNLLKFLIIKRFKGKKLLYLYVRKNQFRNKKYEIIIATYIFT